MLTIKLNDDIVIKTTDIRTNHKIKLPDAIIAATAIVQGLELLTRNADDFKSIPDLKIINPWLLKQ